MREVKLPAMLKQLVDDSEYHGSRKRVSTELGITPAALSQYINGQTTPSLDKLLAMTELFNVSLDFLVFGPDTIAGHGDTLEYGRFTRYVEAGMASYQADIAAQSAFVTKVGEILAQHIDTAARAASRRPFTLRGMLDKEQAIEIERYSEESTILTLDLADDLVQVDSDVEQSVTAGNFLAVVAENLALGRRYHFVLPPDMQDRDALVHQYRTLLQSRNLTAGDLDRCRFSVAMDTFYVGCCLFRLDTTSMRRRSPVLYRFVEEFITPDNHIGFIEPTSSTPAYFLLDLPRRQLAARVLHRLTPQP
ncbi:helix-turn-helix domain-containing protein [Nocardia sp. NPDC057227]|uniref:helix-turn-helix domain-containing protein n=1 Tax=Nocardia sp. NPDC057227 TaxID=3346056 RepID=UPI003625D2AD